MAFADTSVLVVCEDAGAAANLAPIARRLRTEGRLFGAIVGPSSVDAFVRHEIDDVEVVRSESDIDGCLARRAVDAVGCILTGSTSWGLRLEARFVLAARASACSTVTYLDYWANYASRLSFPSVDRLELLPDVLAVVDARMRAELVALGIRPERISITGAPAFDELWSLRESFAIPSANEVLFLSQPIRQLYGETLGYTEVSVLRELAIAVAELGMTLTIRPHPREDRRELAELAASLPGNCRVVHDESLHVALKRARLVIGMTTMALVEAAILGKATISMQFGAEEPVEIPSVRCGTTLLVRSKDAVQSAVATAISTQPKRFDVEGWSPGASERLHHLLGPQRRSHS